jgi:hypothetical protein
MKKDAGLLGMNGRQKALSPPLKLAFPMPMRIWRKEVQIEGFQA